GKLADGRQQVTRRQDTVAADQSAHLRTERPERNEVNDSEQTKKKPGGARVGGGVRAAAPQESCDAPEEGAMVGDSTVRVLAGLPRAGHVLVDPQGGAPACACQRANHRFRALEHL